MVADFINVLQYLGITADNLVPLLLFFIILDKRIEDKLESKLNPMRFVSHS